jgi:hypothetical protein
MLQGFLHLLLAVLGQPLAVVLAVDHIQLETALGREPFDVVDASLHEVALLLRRFDENPYPFGNYELLVLRL